MSPRTLPPSRVWAVLLALVLLAAGASPAIPGHHTAYVPSSSNPSVEATAPTHLSVAAGQPRESFSPAVVSPAPPTIQALAPRLETTLHGDASAIPAASSEDTRSHGSRAPPRLSILL